MGLNAGLNGFDYVNSNKHDLYEFATQSAVLSNVLFVILL